jgi:flavin reductase (DIM6/NTAB) family NADH-FMN oxidoreductase RutF
MTQENADIPVDDFNARIFNLWDKNWLALASGDFQKGDFNVMTVAWGSMGIMWNLPFAMVVVRPTRYTFEFINKYDTFSLSAFPDEFRSALNILGTKSGRDSDKVKEAGLTPVQLDQIEAPGFSQADLTIQCRRIYWDDLDPTKFLLSTIDDHYEKKDYHRMVFGEIKRIQGNRKKYSAL